MSDLQVVFRKAFEGIEPMPVVGGDTAIDLGARLAALCARGRAGFPSLALDDETFVSHLARCIAGGREGSTAPEDLAVEDLFLACACAERVPGAVEAFEARCAGPIRAVLGSFTRVASQQEDIEQLVRMAVLVGSADTPPKIGSYQGRGPLGRWVGVVAQRIALATIRSDDLASRARVLGSSGSTLDWRDPGISLIKQQYRDAFQKALEDAIGKLAGRPRLLLRLNLVDGVSTVSLAKMFGVTQPTASRWLAAAREEVAEELKRLLGERLSLAPAEIESLAGLVISRLDLNLSMLLATS